MPTDVVMPQMGESIAEGTVTRWIKNVGDRVERDEPLFEISTDKVDAEIPSPAAGILTEILAKEGETVAVNSVVARLAAEGEATAPAAPQPAAPEPKPEPAAAPAPPPPAPQPAPAAAAEEKRTAAGGPYAAPAATPAQQQPPAAAATSGAEVTSLDERRRTRSSPLVRKIAEENQVDISQVQGSGVSGRVTKEDILSYIQQPQRPAAAAPAARPASPAARPAPAPEHRPPFAPGENVRIEPMSVMRKRIAEHMVYSKKTSAHVSTVFEVDFTKVDQMRRANKAAFAEKGVNLTFMPFILAATVAGLREWPVLNASIDGENVVYHSEINVGIAVALDWGLIVPVVRHADEKNLLGLARAIGDLGERARSKKLNPDEVQGGTFTITNPGIYGGMFGLPIINQPQVAILGVGGIQKRPVVVETEAGDSIAIRSMCYLSLTFDHRLVDGAVADQFMARVKQIIEAGEFSV